MSEKTSWVCLKCFNRWEPRSDPEGKPQCSNKECKSRLTVEYDELKDYVETIRDMKDRTPFPIGKLFKPPTGENLEEFFSSTKELLSGADPRFPEGVDSFQSVGKLAFSWDPEEEELEEAIDRLSEQE